MPPHSDRPAAPAKARTGQLENRLADADRPAHDWYRFVLSFPPHLVRTYLQRFGCAAHSLVLDPFSGTGTTVVECQKLGVGAVGLEANPMAAFAGQTKLDWSVAPHELDALAKEIAARAQNAIEEHQRTGGDFCRLADDQQALLLRDSMSPQPLHETLLLLREIDVLRDLPGFAHARLALARTSVFDNSNLHFGPEVGIGRRRLDPPVVANWLATLRGMGADLHLLTPTQRAHNRVIHADAREAAARLPPQSIDAVITSPPYPNEKDYSRTTRLESVLLGFVNSKAELRAVKQQLVRSNTRGVYAQDTDGQWVASFASVQRLADAIEVRRIELGKTSGFERLYARVTRLYFGGMARHLAALRAVLKPGAQLAYVVGDQASYFQVMIRTGEILAEIAVSLGYQLVGIDLFRTRLATATGEQLREEVVVLRWPGAPLP